MQIWSEVVSGGVLFPLRAKYCNPLHTPIGSDIELRSRSIPIKVVTMLYNGDGATQKF